MDSKLLTYIRNNYLEQIPGRREAMKYFCAATYPITDKWPNHEEIQLLKDSYSKGELEKVYYDWEDKFEDLAEQFYDQNKDELIINRCPKCNEITIAPGSERCIKCKHTWYGENPHRNRS